MSQESRQTNLEASHLLHPHPEAVQTPLFVSGSPFFLALDKIQVKYEMLRAHAVESVRVNRAAAEHGYSRPAFYLIAAAFEERGMLGLLDEPRGRRGRWKLTPEIAEFLRAAAGDVSGARLALQVEERYGVFLHRRTVERLRHGDEVLAGPRGHPSRL